MALEKLRQRLALGWRVLRRWVSWRNWGRRGRGRNTGGWERQAWARRENIITAHWFVGK